MNIYGKQLCKSMCAVLVGVALSGNALLASAAAEYGTADEAKAMLERSVAAVKANKSEALAKFNDASGPFKDRDLYTFCIGPDGISTAGPTKGQNARDIKDKNGKMLGREILSVAKEGQFAQVDYMWPRPGTTEPVHKVSFVTKVSDQVCGVGYYN